MGRNPQKDKKLKRENQWTGVLYFYTGVYETRI